MDCKIIDTQFIGCTIGPGTKWTGTELAISDFAGVILSDSDGAREIFDPVEIERVLRQCGAVLPVTEAIRPPGAQADARVPVLERLLKHARTHYYLSRQERWFKTNLAGDPLWNEVEELLKRHGLMEDIRINKSGRPEVFLRLTVAPDAILRARSTGDRAHEAARILWSELENTRRAD